MLFQQARAMSGGAGWVGVVYSKSSYARASTPIFSISKYRIYVSGTANTTQSNNICKTRRNTYVFDNMIEKRKVFMLFRKARENALRRGVGGGLIQKFHMRKPALRFYSFRVTSKG